MIDEDDGVHVIESLVQGACSRLKSVADLPYYKIDFSLVYMCDNMSFSYSV